MRVKNKFIKYLVIISTLLIFMLFGCSKEDKSTSSSNTDTLNMYVNFYDKRTLDAIHEFNTTNKVKISTSILTDDQLVNGEYIKKITTSILAGEGPDIVLDLVSSFPSLNKIVENKAFCDLNQYINEDKQMNLSDFNTKVLDCGVVNNKRYFIPLNFRIPAIWSSKNFLERNNITIDDSKWTFEDLNNIKTDYLKNQSTKKYLIVTDFCSILESCWDEYINISQGKTNFNSKDFIHLLDEYKTLYPYMLQFSEIKRPEYFFEYMNKDSLLFAFGEVSPQTVWMNNTAVNKILNSQLKLFLYPGISGKNHPVGLVDEFVAINNSSKNKKEAYKFIKLLLSEKFQERDDIPFQSVNKKAHKTIVNKYYGENGNNKIVYNYKPLKESRYLSIPLTDELVSQINNYTEDMDTCSFIDTNILKMINEEVDSFILGKQTSSQTAKIINDRVSIYLNE